MVDFRIGRLFSGRDFSLEKRFSHIYSSYGFGGRESRSGEGSDLVQTVQIRQELPGLVRKYGISSFLDAPCGDWYWMKEVNLGVGQYIGIDIVEELIEKNRNEFGNSSRAFQCLNLVEDQLPQVDLIFCRDCLVHLNFTDIHKVIANFKRSSSKYLLTTTFTDRQKNIDLRKNGIWRPLNLQSSPFNFPEPLKLIDEKCTEGDNHFTDKSLGLWQLEDLR